MSHPDIFFVLWITTFVLWITLYVLWATAIRVMSHQTAHDFVF